MYTNICTCIDLRDNNEISPPILFNFLPLGIGSNTMAAEHADGGKFVEH